MGIHEFLRLSSPGLAVDEIEPEPDNAVEYLMENWLFDAEIKDYC